MEDKDKFIDALLDSGLAHRSKPAPGPGFEARILEGARAAGNQRPGAKGLWKFLAPGWIAAAVAAAMVTIFIAVRWADRRPTPPIQTPQASSTVSTEPPGKGSVPSSKTAQSAGAMAKILNPKPARPHKSRQAKLSKAPRWPAQFPTPRPLLPEEKALIRYVRETPPEVLAASLLRQHSSAQRVEIKPLKIPPLEIQPLSLGSTRLESQ